jgi:hypothetical protein
MLLTAALNASMYDVSGLSMRRLDKLGEIWGIHGRENLDCLVYGYQRFRGTCCL